LKSTRTSAFWPLKLCSEKVDIPEKFLEMGIKNDAGEFPASG
jgi:hypothetical protein